ncbi:MAG TPA: hypothetical protein VHT52_23270 [Stellaceae bacterium]|nr:hypothetical protein [Stellaceae bacterium]
MLTTLASTLARAIGLLTTLVTVPLAIRYLGGERYGLWMTITSLIAMIGFLDLGIGNALIGAIAEAQARNDREQARGAFPRLALYYPLSVRSCSASSHSVTRGCHGKDAERQGRVGDS